MRLNVGAYLLQLLKRSIALEAICELDPPKHVYATWRDVATGAVYERVYVGKHCNAWRDNEIGAEYNLSVKVWQRPDGSQYYTFNNMYSALCSGETR